MKKLSKILILLLSLIMVLSLAAFVACKTEDKPGETPNISGDEGGDKNGDGSGDENKTDEQSLTLPVSIDISVGESVKTFGGTLDFSLKQDVLDSDNYLDAFSLNLSLDISALPIVSDFANELTLRYVGDGVLLLTLSKKTDTAVNRLLIYPIDLKDSLAQAATTDFSSENLQDALSDFVSIEKTDDGYTLALTDAAVTKLNEAYTGLLEKLKTVVGDLVPSLFGLDFTSLEIEVAVEQVEDTEQFTGINISVATVPAERTGELIDFTLDVGLLSRTGMLSPFNGKLQLRLNPSAVWTGDYYSIAQAQLHLDLTPAANVLGLVGQFAPAGSLPPFVGTDMNNMDVYYTGDGVLALAINNVENAPLFVTQIDLKTAQTATLAEEGQEEPGVSTLPPLEFKLEKKANGFIFMLGNPVAAIIDAAYQQLVKTAVDYIVASAGGSESIMGSIAGQLVTNMLGATITNLELFVGTNADGKQMLDFAIKGIPLVDDEGEIVGQGGKEVEVRLISLTFTDNAPLTAEQQTALSSGKTTVDNLLAQYAKDNATATEFAERLQPYIENIVLTDDGKDDYVAAVDALKAEFDKLPANVQTLISNASYMANTSYSGQTYSKLHVIYELYLARVNEFKELLPAGDNYAEFNDWDELNALYDNADNSHNFDLGVIVPAVKDSPEMKAAIGEARITAYINARSEHEEAIAQDLSKKITASAEKYKSATDRQELTDALVEIINDFKPAYDKLSEDKQALVENYQDYVKTIYLKNIEGVTKAYNDIKQKLNIDQTPDGSDLTTAEELLNAIKELSYAYAWGAGLDYWSSSTAVIQEWGKTWVSSLKPSTLTDEEQAKVSDLNTLQRSFIRGNFAAEIATKYAKLIKDEVSKLQTQLSSCKTVLETETTWNFETLGDEKAEVLEKLHGLRFLLKQVIRSDKVTEIWGEDADLKAFADDLGNYETNLEKEIKAGA